MGAVGNRLREIRSRRGWAQWHAASRAGVSPTVTNTVERWDYAPKLSTRQKTADALGFPVSAIWSEGGNGGSDAKH